MIDLEWSNEYSLYITELIVGVMGLILIFSAGDMDKRQKRLYLSSIIVLMLLSLAELGGMLSVLYEDIAILRLADLIKPYLYLPLEPIRTMFLLYCCGEGLRHNKTFYTICALRAAQLFMTVLYAIIGPPFSILPGGSVEFSPIAVIDVIFGVGIIAFDLIVLVRRWKKLPVFHRVFFAVSMILPHFWLILFLELLIIHEQNQRYLRQKEALATEKTRVAVLQMRPHFIFNTLMSIYALCKSDPDKARQVIKDFNGYLQTNFTAIACEEPVPFRNELQHTQAYLAVEKARYEDKLYIEFDTPVRNFKLPPLTLQPVVENAVKYGLSPELEPLYISVLTEETEGGVNIIVVDTGPGYDPLDNSEPHIALSNISERLKTMCGGTLKIMPREDGGTEVTIFVPWENG